MEKKQKQSTTPDFNQTAFNIVAQATGEAALTPNIISQLMSELGRRGGLKGGKARARALSASKRTAIAKKAAQSRWKNQSSK
jgi:hypothetical protein